MNVARDWAALIGRALLAFVFVPAGYSKIGGFAGTAGYMASKGLPAVEVLLALTIALELGGGLMLFTLLAALLFHNYWAMPEAEQMMQRLMFVKNLGIAGGLLMVFAFGPGRLSVDRG